MRPEEDLSRAKLGDQRRTKRGATIAAILADRPERSLPEAICNDSALDVAYRWFGNDDVEWTAVIAAHIDATWQRAKSYQTLLAVHDTTDIVFPRRNGRIRKNLAGITKHTQGFYSHTSILVDVCQPNEVLGAVGLQPYVHVADVADDPETIAFWRKYDGYMDNEFERWWQAIQRVEQAKPAGPSIIHVGDRETDDYALYGRLQKNGYRFVFRSFRDRSVCGQDEAEKSRISEAINSTPWRDKTRTVALSARSSDRSAKDMKTNPPRKHRLAKLSFRACRLRLRRPDYLREASDIAETLDLNFVEVLERNPPQGEEAVRWLLVTTEPIDSDDDIIAIIDIYRGRWKIEEFFKCLKSGCLMECAQLDTASALLNLLAIFMPVVTYLLHIRYMQRQHPEAPATTMLSDDELHVLKQEKPNRFSLPIATVNEAVNAIAALGGHLKRNGQPGWLTLARGLNSLFYLVQGWRLAVSSKVPDS
jgi:hypothetical protein